MKLYNSIGRVLARKGCEVWSVSPTTTVFDALLRMSLARVGALLVLDEGRLTGIVSERDYARKVALEGRSSKGTLVQEIMTSPVVFVRLTATVAECLQLMTDRRIRHLPVLNGETVVGVISIGDLVQWIISPDDVVVEELHSYAAGGYAA